MEENDFKITKEEMLEALSRSGYLLESEITKQLSDMGYFVESNLTTLDPITGKSREIDLFAEHHQFDRTEPMEKIGISTRFVFEIKNNSFPLVLLTEFEQSPYSNIEESLKVAETIPQKIYWDTQLGFFTELFSEYSGNLYTQYCSFSKKSKKDELIALHPDNLYSAISKITYYCEETVEKRNTDWMDIEHEYLRNFLYLPVLLINNDLFELWSSEEKHELKKVSSSRLVFNYHYKQEPKTAIVFVVTRAGLGDFLYSLDKVDKLVKKKMIEAIKKSK